MNLQQYFRPQFTFLKMVALQAKILLATQYQLPLEISSMGVMTGNTGCHLSVARIFDTSPDRMAELSLGFMADQANLVAVSLEQSYLI